MNALTNTIVIVIVLLVPVGLGYGWYFYWTRMAGERFGWRGRVTLAELTLVTVAAVMWPVAHITSPKANWQTWVGAAAYLHWICEWRRAAIWILLGGMVTSFFGRPRLILPVVVACLGVGLFWVFTDIP